MKTTFLILLALWNIEAVSLNCETNEISCNNEEKCIPHSYVCDGDLDCDDFSDEYVGLCDAWKNENCGKNEVLCPKDGGNSECVTIYAYCTAEKTPCEGDLDPRICEMLKNGKLENLHNIVIETPLPTNLNKSYDMADKFLALVPYTMSHSACPSMFTLVGDQCLSIFHIGSMSWGESREFCKILDGDLISFKNVSHYTAVVQHLQQHELSSSFWIGGYIANKSEGWIWVDGTPVEMGSPYWATRYSEVCVERNGTSTEEVPACLRYYQAPEKEVKGQCIGLDFEHFFYMGDENCLKRMSPLCVYLGSENSSSGFRAKGAY